MVRGLAMLNKKLLGSVSSLPQDDNFENVTLLLNGDGTNGAQNNTFVDSSTNNFTITRNGNTTQGSFSPYGDLWSNNFTPSGTSFLSIPANSGFNDFGTGDFTIECWFFARGTSAYGLAGTPTFNTSGWILLLNNNTAGRPSFMPVPFANEIESTVSYIPNTWNHVAVTRASGTVTIWLNGASVRTATYTASISNSNALAIGQAGAGWDARYYFDGYISNFRIVKGTAVYTSAFTPSTVPLTAISGTSVLTCQSNRFRDASSNNFAITVNGTPSVQRFSPFEPTAPYSTSVIGGSGYFDGSGDFLQTTSNQIIPDTGNFTLEGWIYCTNATGNVIIFSQASGSGSQRFQAYHFDDNTMHIQFGLSANSYTSTNKFNINAWNYFTITRSGSTFTIFINGVLDGTYSSSMTIENTTLRIANFYSNAQYFLGYMSDFRLTNSVLYTSTFSLPTAPLLPSSARLLLSFQNAGIPDLAMQNNLETVGNAQVSTSVKKYGTGSLAFDGTGDWLTMPSSQSVAFGTGDFTVEFWYYTSTTSGWRGLITTQSSDGEANTFRLLLVNGNTGIRLKVATTDLDFTQTLVANAWNHVALVKSSGVYSLYYNGTKNGTTHSNSTSLNAKPMTIAANLVDGTEPFTGYIDDLRITKGVARYTTTFTPPASALPSY
jgi:hypothetical protein